MAAKFQAGDLVTDCAGNVMRVVSGPHPTEEDTQSYLCEDQGARLTFFVKEPLLDLHIDVPIQAEQVWRSKNKPDQTAEILGGPYDERGREVWVYRMTNGALSLTGESFLHQNYALEIKAPVRRARRTQGAAS